MYTLFNNNVKSFKDKTFYHGLVSNNIYYGVSIKVRRLHVVLDTIISDEKTDISMRRLTFRGLLREKGFSLIIPENNLKNNVAFSYIQPIQNGWEIYSTEKQEVAKFIKEYSITKKDRWKAIGKTQEYSNLTRNYKKAIELLKKLR